MSRTMHLFGFEESRLSSLGDALKDARVERRIIALRLVAAGKAAREVGQAVSVDERTVRFWVKDFNRDGIDSLRYDHYQGAKPQLPPEKESEVVAAILSGPPKEMGITVWRAWAIGKWLEQEYGVVYSRTGVYALLHRLGLSSLMPRPHHPESDATALEKFKKNSPRRSGSRGKQSQTH